MESKPRLALLVAAAFLCATPAHAFGTSIGAGVSSRAFLGNPGVDNRPKLILIGGCPGTGKSTFGMAVALDQGILKCISTDTLRSVMRSFIGSDISPALHRSSYQVGDEGDDPVRSWRETCTVLGHSVEELVQDAIDRNVSLVVEGVHLVPSNELIDRFEANGGVAMGCLLTIPDKEVHKKMLMRRGDATGKGEDSKLAAIDRVRQIQEEMIRLAKESNWMLIEQNPDPDPLERVANQLLKEQVGVNMDVKTHKKKKTDASIGLGHFAHHHKKEDK